jgi:hypothetical protein
MERMESCVMTPPPSPLAKQDERYRCYTMPFSTTVPY